MDEHEGEGAYRCREHGVQGTAEDPFGECHPALHERGHVLRARADEVHVLPEPAGGLGDEVLSRSPVICSVARIDDALLQSDQLPLVAGVERCHESERLQEPLLALRAGRFTFDGER